MSVRERPIIIQAESVRAILAGRKTQTRRVVKPQPGDVLPPIRVEEYEPVRVDRNGEEYAGEPIFGAYSADGEWGVRCPYGAPGDRLWVREAWRPWFNESEYAVVQYRADGATRKPEGLDVATGWHFAHECDYATDESPWRSPLFMPRWASRLTLEITDVRVQRLQEISEQDAEAEGIVRVDDIGDGNTAPAYAGTDGSFTNGWSAQSALARVWDAINGRRFPWSANPWVWAVTFKRVEMAHVST